MSAAAGRRKREAAEEAGMWMKVAEVAVLLGVSDDTVRRHAKGGLIPGFQLGTRWRFRRDLIERFVEKESRAGLRALHASK